MLPSEIHTIAGLVIGQLFENGQTGELRIVAIDPELHSLQAENGRGEVVLDTIEHFTATHRSVA